MDTPSDLTDFLRGWPYDEDENVRFITTADGREIMQIRQPMGVEQYELDGRPDGNAVEGGSTYLDYYAALDGEAAKSERPFELRDEDFNRLRTESVLYYFRYLALFQVGQYDRVARDTRHNLDVCDIVRRRYTGEDKDELLQYLPYIRRVNAISKAMLSLADDRPDIARQELESAVEDIENQEPAGTPVYQFEKIRSLQHLKQVIAQVESVGVVPHERKGLKERLEEELRGAVEKEDYERAARLRDRLNRLS